MDEALSSRTPEEVRKSVRGENEELPYPRFFKLTLRN